MDALSLSLSLVAEQSLCTVWLQICMEPYKLLFTLSFLPRLIYLLYMSISLQIEPDLFSLSPFSRDPWFFLPSIQFLVCSRLRVNSYYDLMCSVRTGDSHGSVAVSKSKICLPWRGKEHQCDCLSRSGNCCTYRVLVDPMLFSFPASLFLFQVRSCLC
jgi:hypothetical protein